MDIEIVIIGESNKWVLNQPRIRIGQDSRCEVTLPAAKYPAVLGEHATLDVSDGAIKLGKGVRPGGEVFLNGHPSGIGTIVRSGDVLRLGSGGPELRIRIQEQETSTRSGDYEPTRVLYQPSSTVHDGAPPRPGRRMKLRALSLPAPRQPPIPPRRRRPLHPAALPAGKAMRPRASTPSPPPTPILHLLPISLRAV